MCISPSILPVVGKEIEPWCKQSRGGKERATLKTFALINSLIKYFFMNIFPQSWKIKGCTLLHIHML